ncbi:hypothetical protein LSM04_003683 [Trypanosoma melophagium]|uniref:uncharacterized protein n=1 Tax=Trypanosoma melophagium TaxID=715481 RepID=UPI00351A067A|nr:hypothetical protein LSM04_003683 [Trypanosoma melophagium]
MVYAVKRFTVITVFLLLLFFSPYVTSAEKLDELVDTLVHEVEQPSEMLVPFVTPVRQSLQCHTVWKGPSADNDILDCLKSVERLLGDWKSLLLPALNVALLVVLLVTFPTLFCCVLFCRCCCTPDTRGRTERARCCIWLWITYALLWSVAVYVLVYSGVGILVKATPVLLNDTVHGPLDYFNSTAERIIDFSSNWTSGKREPIKGIPLDLRDFSAVHEQAMGFVKVAEDYYLGYLDKVSLATYCIGGIGFVLLLLLLPFACCHCCIPCFPLIVSCLYWVVGVLFAVLGAIVTLLSLLSGAACGELELQHHRMPGVFQWYAVPFCQKKFNFTSINKMVRDAELQFSHMSCEQLLNWCDTKPEPDLSKIRSLTGGSIPGSTENAATSTKAKLRAIPPGHMPTFGGSGGSSKLRANLPGFHHLGGAGVPAINGLGAGTPDLSALAGAAGVGGIPGGLENLSPDLQKSLTSKNIPNIPGGLPDLKDIPGLKGGRIPDLSEFMQSGGLASLGRPLMCGMGITSKNQCSDFGSMAAVLLTTKVKAFAQACPRKDSSCTLAECALNCTNEVIRSTAAGIIMGASIARNASIALSYAKPLLECNFVIDKLATAMKQCNDLKAGSLMLGVGFFVGGLMFGLAIYITLRGACIWGRMPGRRKVGNPKRNE